ncbi:MAG: hypothetical protein J1F35_03675 [Erysipelotrichales bacterium]|nr:hypothetical protein [Erysipelotrichales bacterium]
MKCYNIYHDGQKINRRPLTKKDIDIILEKEKISKIVNSTNIKEILISDCKIVECTVI